MQESGFDRIIRDLLERGMVYGGDSAGALVAGPSLHGVEWADQPEFAEEAMFDGLGLIQFVPLPHAGSLEYGEAVTKMKELYAGEGAEYLELTDSQAVIIDGVESRVVQGAA